MRTSRVGKSRLHWLHREGIKTAYDIHKAGSARLDEIYSIGPTLAESLVEWANSQIPPSEMFDWDEEKHRSFIERVRGSGAGETSRDIAEAIAICIPRRGTSLRRLRMYS